MFTALAIIFTIAGIPLFAHGGIKDRREDFSRTNHIGGLFLVISAILWVVVIIALFAMMIAWLWEVAP